MPRRVAPALRGSLLVIGLLIYSSLALTFFYSATVRFDVSGKGHEIGVWSGAIVWTSGSDISYQQFDFRVGDLFPGALRASLAIYPQIRLISDGPLSFRALSIPLWLLAFLCLAWPVTSFVIARRRRRTRGFEVEAVVKDEGGGLR